MSDLSWLVPAGFNLPASAGKSMAPMYEIDYSGHAARKDGKFKWTVAYFAKGSEGYDLRFVGDRPLDSRVNWDHFRELVILGQRLADDEWESGERNG